MLFRSWAYSLYLQANNCENAANFISTGERLSTQCLSGSHIAQKITLSTEIPDCVKDNSSFSPRIMSKRNYICKGTPFLDDVEYDDYGDPVSFTKKCTVDKRYCRSQDCPDIDDVEGGPYDNKIEKVCMIPPKSANNFKILS